MDSINTDHQDAPAERIVSSKKNPFRVGDAVRHPISGHKGIVKEVSSTIVKFDVFGLALPGGRRMTVRYSWRKLEMVATREQLFERVKALQAEIDAAGKPAAKVKGFFRRFFPKG